MLLLIGEGGTIAIRDETILAVMNENLPVWLGWTLCIGGLAVYALITFRTMREASPGRPAGRAACRCG